MSTLKLTKPVDRSAAAKPKTTRARDAQRRMHTQKAQVEAPAAEPVTQPPKPAARKPRFAKPDERKARAPGPDDRKPRVGKPDDRKPRFTKPDEGKTGAPAPDRKPRFAKPGDHKPRAARPEERRPPAPRTEAPKPRTAPTPGAHGNPGDPRLSKLMSERGLCSRREADEWIENGWVKVDGRAVTTLGSRVPADATIEIDEAAKRHQGEQVTILLNKPVGYVSGQPEDDHPPALALIVPDNHWAEDSSRIEFKRGHLRNLAPAGRLDIDSTGLLVFTQDVRVAKRLIGHDSEVEKEYLVRVEGTLDEAGLEKLRHGLELDGVKLKPARVSWQNEEQLRFVLREGKKRQIRRMCEMVGLVVTGLKRVRTGGVPLGKLPPGQWRYLRRDERF
jgi:23S rRNA pseudouridine2604 synthase